MSSAGRGPAQRPLPRLVVITDWSQGEGPLLRALAALMELGSARPGALALQHRHPGADDRTLLREARELTRLCGASGVPVFVNGRLDLALLTGAHLHLPARGPDVAEVRPLLPPERWVSVAVHDEDEAARAHGADFALVSPVFGAGSKPGDTRAPLGVEGFTRLAKRLPCPAFALGGITQEIAPRLGGAAFGVAAITGVLRAPDPARAAEALLAALEGLRPAIVGTP